jgi:hypothetical protein
VGHARSADDLFRRWVVADADATVLDTRAAARAAYARLADEARDWAIPLAIRQPLSDWSFASVGGLVTSAETVLRQRDAIAGFAGGLGIAPPTDLRSAFEHAASSFDEAIGIGAAELRGVQTVEAAADAVAAPRAPLVSLGLLGTDPEARLGAVLAAFSAGLPSAAADAAALRQTIVDAADVGRERLLDGIGVAVIVVLLLVLASGLLWRRRRARLAVQPVEGPSIVPAVAVEPAAMAVEPPAMAVESTTAEPVGVAPTAVEPAPEAIGLDPTAGRPMADTASATLADQSAGPVTGAVEPPSDRGETS